MQIVDGAIVMLLVGLGIADSTGAQLLGKGLLQIGDVDVHKTLQVVNVTIVVVVVAMLFPAIHLLVDGPHLEIFGL